MEFGPVAEQLVAFIRCFWEYSLSDYENRQCRVAAQCFDLLSSHAGQRPLTANPQSFRVHK